jgi:hypothetical protein
MEVTALKGSSGDVQHFSDRIIAERRVRYGRVAMIPTSAKTKRRPKAYLMIEMPVVACPFRGQSRHFDPVSISSGPPRIADILGVGRHVRNVPNAEVS